MAAPISQSSYTPLLHVFRRDPGPLTKGDRPVRDTRLPPGQSRPPSRLKGQPNTSGGPASISRDLPTVDEIRQHRGQTVDASNARCDVNGDGRITVADILYLRELLNNSRSNRIRRHMATSQTLATTGSESQPSGPAHAVTKNEAAAAQQGSTNEPTFDQIRQHRGEAVDESNARYDLNGDGKINVADILLSRNRS